jgi:hypothetical protein
MTELNYEVSFMLSLMLSVTYNPFVTCVIMLNAVILRVIMLSVVAPSSQTLQYPEKYGQDKHSSLFFSASIRVKKSFNLTLIPAKALSAKEDRMLRILVSKGALPEWKEQYS